MPTITSPTPPDEPMFVVINLAVGTPDQTPVAADYPESFDIDYVRVWNDWTAKP